MNDVRAEMENDGRLEKFTSRTSGDGRVRPASQPSRPEPEPTPDDVIRAYVAENPGKSNREVADDLGVNRKTVDALAQNVQSGQNGPPSPEPEPEPPAPSWEPAGQLDPGRQCP